MRADLKRESRQRRHRRVRKRITGGADRPRMAVFRSNRHIYVQLVDDLEGRTLVSASSLEVDAGSDKKDTAKRVGELIARKAREAGVERVVFDRGGRLYHGRVRSVAEGAREGGLKI